MWCDSEDYDLGNAADGTYLGKPKCQFTTSAVLIMSALCFMLGIILGDQSGGSYFNNPHLQFFASG